ncbi:cell division protein FtsQ/DivIB [Roseimaritima ulvae]|uniref:Cell division protein FtsQ n=1 Tax=Roseimaritima ulvae TaxID=980254 RepID=A0A5B9QLS3_9BACT|nr:hypothetical protein [Roseimaritima ulvae]QEG38485.1 Cell division protein FtsQ [Roseimaritima ulvae]
MTKTTPAKSPKQAKSPPRERPLRRFLGLLIRRIATAPMAFAFLWPAMLAVGGYWAWHHWGVEHVGSRFARLETSEIHLTQRPQYIPERIDLTQEVLDTTALGELSLLDRQVSARIAQAYATHPWIQQVVAVRIQSGGEVDVQVRYRQPVAMVRHLSRHAEVQGWAYYPVDPEGIVLPPNAFTGNEAKQYLVINIPQVDLRGTPGFSCGDSRVTAAAALAAILSPYRQELGLAAIELHAETNPNQRYLAFDIVTQSGRRLVWGSAPGKELNGEPPADLKMQALLQSPPPGTDLRVAALTALRRQQATELQ